MNAKRQEWMRRGGRAALAAAAAWGLLSVPAAAGVAGKAGFQVLRVSPFARAASMAEAATAYVSDAMMVYSNPAGLAHMTATEASAQHSAHFQGVTSDNLTVVWPYRRGGWGVTAGTLGTGDIPRTRYDPSVTDRFVEAGQVDAGDRWAGISWGYRQTANLAVGLSARAVQETLDGESAVVAVGDAGAIYRVNRRWRLAAAFQNAGSTAKFISESVAPPARARAAALWSPEKWMQWEADVVQNLPGDREILVGGELNWRQTGFARLGYRHTFESADLGASNGISMGGGLQAGSFRIDYAFVPAGDLGDSHRFSASWRFARAR